MEVQQQPQDAQEAKFKLFYRVSNYPMVTSLMNTTTSMYTTVRESNSLVKKGCETMENSVNWLAEKKLQPLIETNAYHKYTDPLLSTVDTIGMRSLDVVDKLGESYQSSKKMIGEKVTGIKNTGCGMVEAGMHKIGDTIVPIDQYLAGSLLAAPLNIGVNVAEKVVDYIIPEQQQQATMAGQDQSQQQHIVVPAGPIMKATRISQKLQKEAFSKLHNLRLRSPEAINAMQVVDLLNYAADKLDNIVKHTKESGTNTMNSMKDRIHITTSDVVATLNNVSELMAKQLSGPYDMVKQKTFQVMHLENEQDIHNFSDFAKQSAAKLRQSGASLMTSVSSNEKLQSQFSSVKETVMGVLDNLQKRFGKHQHTQ